MLCLYSFSGHRGTQWSKKRKIADWADLTAHSRLAYHMDSMAKMQAFLHTAQRPSKRLDLSMPTAIHGRVQRNRQILGKMR